MYHSAMSKKSEGQVAIASATNERTKFSKMSKYLDMMEKDTSSFNEERLKRHNQALDQMQLELFG